MGGRSAALLAATVASAGAVAAAATAVTGPPPPPRATRGAVVQPVAIGLGTPTSFAFGGGNAFEGDGGNRSTDAPGGVFLLKNGVGVLIPGSPQFAAGLAWHHGTLYVSGASITGPHAPKWQLLAWSGWNGTRFTRRKAVYTAPKRFAGFNGLAVGRDGRLYLGVDGITDNSDHGPAGAPPDVRDILSVRTDGSGLEVFATGIRQPWQFVFPAGSASPLVSGLGQDRGARNPPDLLRTVRRGDDYGFPKCNWTAASGCRGYTRLFKRFAAHNDIRGMAIIGSRLYMSSFRGPGGKGTGGKVVSMALKGGPVTPLLTGFVAPVTALGTHAGWLYVGELTGQVFRVRPQ